VSMRVIAGSAKGSRLRAPTSGTRPMTDRMKEAVFSSLGDCGGLRVLDLFAGSGALGLEGLSRGAVHATFVEKEREAILKLEQNMEATKLGDRAEVLWSDVMSTLEHGAPDRFDLVFVDPPYNNTPTAVLEVLEAIVMNGWLSDDGRVVVHRPARERALEPLGLSLEWSRDYGQSNVSVFCHEEEVEG
jgi:16S rRNA (guanine966-N2)-methyltransferase